MVSFIISLSAELEQFLKQVADDHQMDLNKVVNELCKWALSNSEEKEQFETWLDDAFPPKGEVEDKKKNANEEKSEEEEEQEEESEEEAHEDENYNEDISGK